MIIICYYRIDLHPWIQWFETIFVDVRGYQRLGVRPTMASEFRRGVTRGKSSNSLGVSSWWFCTNAVENRFDVTAGTGTRTNVAVHKPDRFEDRHEGQHCEQRIQTKRLRMFFFNKQVRSVHWDYCFFLIPKE